MSTSFRMAEDPRLQESPLQVVKRLFFVSFLMFTMPFLAYFTSKKYLFEDLLHYSNNTSNLLAVIPAVVAVNTVIGIYIYLAWNSEPWKEKFQERTKDE